MACAKVKDSKSCWQGLHSDFCMSQADLQSLKARLLRQVRHTRRECRALSSGGLHL